ncbi:MAG: hypothetical protein ABW213_09790, partial [Tardiphaga sp.]
MNSWRAEGSDGSQRLHAGFVTGRLRSAARIPVGWEIGCFRLRRQWTLYVGWSWNNRKASLTISTGTCD